MYKTSSLAQKLRELGSQRDEHGAGARDRVAGAAVAAAMD